MKVKIFKGKIFSGGLELLEKEVNEFLEKTTNASIVWLQTPLSPSSDNDASIYLTAIVSYQ